MFFFIKPVHLSQFRDPTDGSYILQRLSSTYDPESKSRPYLGVVHHHALEHTLKLVGLNKTQILSPEINFFDGYGPVLVNRTFMNYLEEKYQAEFNRTNFHRFELKDDLCPIHFYLHLLHQDCTRISSKTTCQIWNSKTYHVHDLSAADSITKLNSIVEDNSQRGPTSVFLPEDALKGNFRIVRPEFDSFFYYAFPHACPLETLLDDYGWVGFSIAMFFSAGLLSVCYSITWALGGTKKQSNGARAIL